MVAFVNSFALALLITSISSYRLQFAKRGYVVAYFLGLFGVNFVVDHFFLPPDMVGIEIGLVCLLIWGFFMGVSRFVGRLIESGKAQ